MPNAKLETAGVWGSVVILTLEDGTALKLTRRVEYGETKARIAAFYSVRGEAPEVWSDANAQMIFDFLHDMTQ